MRLAMTRSLMTVSRLLMVEWPGLRCSWWRTALDRTASVGQNKEIVHRNRCGDQRLVGEVGHEGFQSGAVGLDSIRPRIAVEELVDFVDVPHQKRRHVAQRA